MKRKLIVISCFALALLALVPAARAQSTAFTYQGRLVGTNGPAQGAYDFSLSLYNAASGGALVGPTNLFSGLAVTNGLFTVTPDFGPQFSGLDRWLEIAVRTNGVGAFVPLSPRQKLTPTPYALYAPQAGTATTALGVTADAVGTSGLQASSVTSDKIADGSITPADVNTASFSNTFWKVNGNAGANPTNGAFLGTTDNLPLEIRVNGARALRLEPTAFPEVVNVVGGSPRNLVTNGAVGATIWGGGADDVGDYRNTVAGTFGTVSGGRQNSANNAETTVAGGRANTASGLNSTISGGYANTVSGAYGSIGGGIFNLLTSADHGTIGGGYQNTIQSNAVRGTVSGGFVNTVGAPEGTVSGGAFNNALGYSSTIGGGGGNTVRGGWSTIAGGRDNNQTNADYATIGGGAANMVGASEATVAGGAFNSAVGFSSVISGGGGNSVTGPWATIAGGRDNKLTNAAYATIGGGNLNMVKPNAFSGTIPGGSQNEVAEPHTLAAGRRAKANHEGAFVWADATDADFTSTGTNQFLIRASGGVGINNSTPGGAALAVGGDVNVEGIISANALSAARATTPEVITPKIGTAGNVSLEFYVNGQRALRLEPTGSTGTVNVIGGSPQNSVGLGLEGATIAGGGIGLFPNKITASYATISGGTSNNASGGWATIGGGRDNVASGAESTVPGGRLNTASGQYSTSMGAQTIASGFASTALGRFTRASNDDATAMGLGSIASGWDSVAMGTYTVAGGHYSFSAGYYAQAINQGSFVWADSTSTTPFASTANNQFLLRAGGGVGINKNNPATALDVNGTITATSFSGSGAALTGLNAAQLAGSVPSATLTAVPAGSLTGTISDARLSSNVALRGGGNAFTGNQVITGGNVGIGTVNPQGPLHVYSANNPTVVRVQSTGTPGFGRLEFVSNPQGDLNEWRPGYIQSTDNGGFVGGLAFFVNGAGAGNKFGSNEVMRVVNGAVGIGTPTPVSALQVVGTVTATAFNPPSDRNLKENFKPVNPREVLDKVAALPISRWNFKGDLATPHVGPMAQDFYAAFGTGTDERHIATVDADGVALAAIQGLNEKVEAELKRNREKDAEISTLKERLERLEAILTQLSQAQKWRRLYCSG